MKKGIIIGLIWLVVINIFALLGLNRVNLEPDTAYGWINPIDFHQQKTWNPIDLHNHWDSFWYLSIARDGYKYNGESGLANIAFLPLYPLLIKIVGLVFGNYAFAGWLLSSIFTLLSCGLLYKLVTKYHQESNAFLSVIFLLIFPTAFFLNGVYSEALFLFLSLAVFYYLFEKRLWLAGLIGLIAALTRITGFFLVIPFLYEAINYFRHKKIKLSCIFSSALMPLGTLGFFLYLYFRFHDFWLFFHVESVWGRAFTVNTSHIFLSTPPGVVNFALDIFFLVFALLCSVLVFLKIRKSYGLYMLGVILAIVASGTLMSFGRYILVLFPIYILLSRIKNEYLKLAWSLFSILLLGLYTLLFVNYYWAG